MAWQAAKRLVDGLLPPQCLGCGELVDDDGRLCPACWSGLGFITRPHCRTCGYPFAYDAGDDAECAACIAAPPAFARARAVLRYDAASRGLVLGFKHGDRLEGARAYAEWMVRAGADLLADADVVAPVPLHRWRLLRRRYNQSAVLALAVGRSSGRPVLVDLMRRTRPTRSQGSLSPAGRARNVRGAFAVTGRHRNAIAGARVVLVDDVLTTGATVSACARSLRRAGAAAVDVLTLTRVVRPLPVSL